MAAVTVIIPNWNGMEHLPTCLNSLMNQTFRDFEIIVVDNGSEDGSVTYIKRHYPQVKLIKLGTNRGFCAAVNVGISTSDSEYIALLNNDVEVDENWLQQLYEAMLHHPEVGFCACKILDFYKRKIIGGTGDGMYQHFFPFPRGANESDKGQYEKREFVFGACAAAAFYKRSIFDTIGLFDEDFFAFYEDVDLSFRAQIAGFKCLYIPEAICYHKGGSTEGMKSMLRVKMVLKNQIFLILKCVPTTLMIKYLPLFLITRMYQIFRLIFIENQAQAVLTSHWDLIKTIPKIYRKRKTLEQLKTVSDKYIESILTPFIPFNSNNR